MEIQRLRDLREDHDKAQWEVAAYLNMHRSVYRRYENGTRETPAWVLDRTRGPEQPKRSKRPRLTGTG